MTAIIMLFEMSNDYRIILPLMIACMISAVVARSLYPANIYTVKLIRRGLDIDAARYPDVFRRVTVREAMTENPECIPAELTIAEACRYIQDSPHQGFPVVDKSGRLTGIITRHELLEARQQRGGDLPVRVAAATNLVVTTPDEPLSVAAVKLSRHDVGRLPVVKPGKPEILTGILTRTDIIEAYSRILRSGTSLSSSLEEARSNMEVSGA